MTANELINSSGMTSFFLVSLIPLQIVLENPNKMILIPMKISVAIRSISEFLFFVVTKAPPFFDERTTVLLFYKARDVPKIRLGAYYKYFGNLEIF